MMRVHDASVHFGPDTCLVQLLEGVHIIKYCTSSKLQVNEMLKSNINHCVNISVGPKSSFHNSASQENNYMINLWNLHEVNTAT
jgi:hypothetical protein